MGLESDLNSQIQGFSDLQAVLGVVEKVPAKLNNVFLVAFLSSAVSGSLRHSATLTLLLLLSHFTVRLSFSGTTLPNCLFFSSWISACLPVVPNLLIGTVGTPSFITFLCFLSFGLQLVFTQI